MDRTTLTANLKPLERRGLVKLTIDKEDKRSRRLSLTVAGRKRLLKALPVWRETHAAIERALGKPNRSDNLRADLSALC
jgi:DNA-binding MarR family transcriptional regulator